MKIGEFAKICGTKISVLRHYDKEGLITPDYADRFTGYRYYSAEQINVFTRITALKKAGFSLKEIKNILFAADDDGVVLASISRKKSEIVKMLSDLEEAKKILLGVDNMSQIFITETDSGLEMKISSVDSKDYHKACEQLEEAVKKQNYQRISNFKTYGEKNVDEIEVRIDIKRLNPEMIKLNEDIDVPFENDEEVIGKWVVIGEYAIKEDFFSDIFKKNAFYGDINKFIYFLPNGERYWAYGWTKGYMICDTGDGRSLNRYEVENYDGETYMFMQNKSYYYRRGGNPTIVVLKKLDGNYYTKQGIARKDFIDMPFVDDVDVMGKWIAFDYCERKDKIDFTKKTHIYELYFKSIEFKQNGECIGLYGDELIANDMQVWTKGYVLRKWNQTACAYEIRKVNDIDYLIMEWKSGDYRWGGFDTDYYIFIRA